MRALAKKTGLSVATVSNALNPKEGAPTPHSLQLLATALEITGNALTELQQLRQQADPRMAQRSPGLVNYLEAASRSAQEYPYPGVLPGNATPLTTLYVRSEHSEAVPAGDVMSQEQNCLILGGPGSGKSTLLRVALATEANRLLQGRSATVPLLVQAADLADRVPLPQAICSAVSADISEFGLLQTLTRDILTEPGVDSPHLLLVDGLDEVLDQQTRREILGKIETAAESGLYRLVVASRPLEETELGHLNRSMKAYYLQDFTPNDLRDVMKRWFIHLRLPKPASATNALLKALTGTRIADLARVPLMATMLCQLHAADPEQALPLGRTGVYERFVELLRERQHSAGKAGIRQQTRSSLERYGSSALEQAEATLDRLTEIVVHLAAEKHAENPSSAIEILSTHPGAQRPSGVSHEVWDHFLRDSLRRSGLLTLRGGELTFLHPTLLEYCASLHAEQRQLQLKEIIDQGWARPRFWTRKIWNPHYWRGEPLERSYSYTSFLLDAEMHSDYLVERLQHLANRGGLEGCAFILENLPLGTIFPEQVLEAAVRNLLALMSNPRASQLHRAQAGDVLAHSRDRQALIGVATLTADPQTDFIGSFQGRSALTKADASALLSIARDQSIDERARTGAAIGLKCIGDKRADSLLASIQRDASFSPHSRHIASVMLGRPVAHRSHPK